MNRISQKAARLVGWIIPFILVAFLTLSNTGFPAFPPLPPLETGQSSSCKPESKFPKSDKVSGFNGLAIEYTIDGLPISDQVNTSHVLSGYPSGSKVTIQFKFSGPYSIQGSWSTGASITVNGKEFDNLRAPDKNGAAGWTYTPKPVVVTITDEIRKNGFNVAANVGYARSSNSEGVSVTVRGLPCSNPNAGQNPLQLPDLTWVVVVGGVGVAGALAAAAALIIRNATRSAKRPLQANETAGFILQLSQTQFTLSGPNPARLRATAWRVLGSGQPQVAPDALITVTPPDPSSGVSISPLTGGGDTFFTIVQNGKQARGQAVFTLSASAQGVSAPDQQVTVNVRPTFTAWVNGQKEATVSYHPLSKTWSLPEIVCFFAGPDGRPTPAGFAWGAPNPPVEFSPAEYVKMEEYYIHDTTTNAFTIRLCLTSPQIFSADAKAAAWLENDGQVKATITVIDDQQQSYTDTVVLHFKPQLRLVAFSFDQKITQPGGHTYLQNRWEGMEFLADGDDRLPLALCYVRTDREIPKGKEYEYAEKGVEIADIQWSVGSSIMHLPEPDTLNTSDGCTAFFLRAEDGVLNAAGAWKQTYRLVVRPRLKAGVASKYTFEKAEETVEVDPQFLLPRFWVIPGQYRDTSLAIAYVKAIPSNKPVLNLPLRLTPLSQGSGFLQLDNCPAEQRTSEILQPKISTRLQITKGVACWTLRYSGITWENYEKAKFQVTCDCPVGKTGPAFSLNQTINVGKNVLDMLRDLFNDKELGKHLTNGYWKGSSLPYFIRGQVWNLIMKLDTHKEFVCHAMRSAIIDWLWKRRWIPIEANDPEAELLRIQCMNGIEFEKYDLVPIHVYAGFFLSGRPKTDYRALDPWWDQRWEDPALMRPENLMSKFDEDKNWAGEIAMAGLIITSFIQLGAAFGIYLTYLEAEAIVTGMIWGAKGTLVVEGLGQAAFGVSTYIYEHNPQVTDGAYYFEDVYWLVKLLPELDKKDAQKYKKDKGM